LGGSSSRISAITVPDSHHLATIKKIPVPKIDIQNPGVKKFFILILPAIVAGGIAQINLLIDTIFASLLITGSPTWLYVSDRLIQFPMGIFAIRYWNSSFA
jgi:putative peptidoglycan lipid II flippase